MSRTSRHHGDIRRNDIDQSPSSNTIPDSHVLPHEHQALIRLLKIADSDTGQSRRVADFLLVWWNPIENGRFDFLDLWQVDKRIEVDVLLVLGLAVRSFAYPDSLGYGPEFAQLVARWRKRNGRGARA
jgi:hypothetical protein